MSKGEEAVRLETLARSIKSPHQSFERDEETMLVSRVLANLRYLENDPTQQST